MVTLKRSWHSLKACTWPQSKHEHLPIEHDRAGEKEEGIHCVTSVIGSRPALALGCSAEVAFRFHSDIRKAIMAYWKARFRASAAVRTPRDAGLKMGTWRKFVASHFAATVNLAVLALHERFFQELPASGGAGHPGRRHDGNGQTQAF